MEDSGHILLCDSNWSLFQLKKHQQKIEMILDSKKVDYVKVDIAGNDSGKEKMREIMGDPRGLPPQLTKGDVYLGVSLIWNCYFMVHTLPSEVSNFKFIYLLHKKQI